MRPIDLLTPKDIEDILVMIRTRMKEEDFVRAVNIDEAADDVKQRFENASEFANQWDERNHDRVGDATDAIPMADLEAGLAEQGRAIYEISWKHVQDDVEAWYVMLNCVLRMAQRGSREMKDLLGLLHAPGAYETHSFPGKWAHFGFQTVEVDDRLAASWCATGLKSDFLDDVTLPWPSFIIRVPTFLRGFRVNGEQVRFIQVTEDEILGKGKKRFRFNILTPNKYRGLTFTKLSDLANVQEDGDLVALDMKNMGEGHEVSKEGVRLVWAVARIVLGVCLTVTGDPDIVRHFSPTPGRPKGASIGSPRFGTPPICGLWKIARPLKVDVRREIQDWVSGQLGKRVQVRTLVAGHWKRQPFGEGRKNRKWIQVEPYWRGPEDAAIAVRAHKVEAGT